MCTLVHEKMLYAKYQLPSLLYFALDRPLKMQKVIKVMLQGYNLFLIIRPISVNLLLSSFIKMT